MHFKQSRKAYFKVKISCYFKLGRVAMSAFKQPHSPQRPHLSMSVNSGETSQLAADLSGLELYHIYEPREENNYHFKLKTKKYFKDNDSYVIKHIYFEVN